MRSLPLHTLPGNHEIECDTRSREIFVPYEHWVANPNRMGDAVTEPVAEDYRATLWRRSCTAPSPFRGVYDYGNAFYSYRHGLAHVIALNSYTSSDVHSAQYRWLETELRERFDRSATPWLVVACHAPLYTTFRGHVNEKEVLEMKAAMEPLFVEYGVNLVVSGKLLVCLLFIVCLCRWAGGGHAFNESMTLYCGVCVVYIASHLARSLSLSLSLS